MRVVPVRERGHRQIDPRKRTVRLVQYVDLHLVSDNAVLVFQILFRDREPTHAVGLGPEKSLELMRWNDCEVISEVEARRAVQHAAVALHQADKLHLAEILRALEHQVLKEVCETGS